MLMVKARAGISQIHAIRLIAREFIPQGTCVWRFQPEFDQVISEEKFSLLPLAAQQFVHYYAYYDAQKGGYVLCVDDDHFTNHSDEPNTQNVYAEDGSFATYAICDIQVGEEITWNYRGWVTHDFMVSNGQRPQPF